ncbi:MULTISPECIES: helix-turn-helix transcriptional regulator [unclassified Bradyrhizobium]|uniref:helix-turn-helix transcriptional regulator n=1 Tax=unclassified Bradyrhizobium TaxID=2631580 RepID=UPI002305D260|nr:MULTISPECIES: AlpA family phage regulatory protein [unclassified Bradyrhizobium]
MESSFSGRGLCRLKSIIKPLGPLQISRSTWWAGVKSGRFPPPVRLGGRLVLWKEQDICRLIEEGIPRANAGSRTSDKP